MKVKMEVRSLVIQEIPAGRTASGKQYEGFEKRSLQCLDERGGIKKGFVNLVISDEDWAKGEHEAKAWEGRFVEFNVQDVRVDKFDGIQFMGQVVSVSDS